MEESEDSEVDARITTLVDALNGLPGIFTFSCCGGHETQTDVSHVPADEFYVNFDVDPLRGGWRSLQLIAYVVGESDESGILELKASSSGGPDGLFFELRGTAGADPYPLASALEAVLDLHDAADEDIEDGFAGTDPEYN